MKCKTLAAIALCGLSSIALAAQVDSTPQKVQIQNNSNYTIAYQINNGQRSALCISSKSSACELDNTGNLAANTKITFQLSAKSAKGPQVVKVPVDLTLRYAGKDFCEINMQASISAHTSLTLNTPSEINCKNKMVRVHLISATPVKVIIQ